MSDNPLSTAPIAFDHWLSGLTDAQVLAVTLLGEARGEDTLGRQMVASTILNRVAIAQAHMANLGSRYWWGMTARDVCLKPWQFSCWNESDPNRPKLMDLTHHPLWPEAMGIADTALAGHLPDRANGATSYVNPAVARAAWAIPAHQVAQHLHHTFYRVA